VDEGVERGCIDCLDPTGISAFGICKDSDCTSILPDSEAYPDFYTDQPIRIRQTINISPLKSLDTWELVSVAIGTDHEGYVDIMHKTKVYPELGQAVYEVSRKTPCTDCHIKLISRLTAYKQQARLLQEGDRVERESGLLVLTGINFIERSSADQSGMWSKEAMYLSIISLLVLAVALLFWKNRKMERKVNAGVEIGEFTTASLP